MADDKPRKQKASYTGVYFTVVPGLPGTTFDLVQTKIAGLDKATELRSLCLECKTPTRVREQLVCEVDPAHGPWTRRDMTRKAREVGDSLVEVSAEEIAAVKDDGDGDDTKSIVLRYSPAVQMRHVVRPGDLAYRIRPGKTTDKRLYGLLKRLVETGEFVAHGELVLRSKARPYLLEVWQGQLVAQSFMRPDDLAATDEVDEVVPTDKELAIAGKLLAKVAGAFDPEDYRNVERERMAALDAAKAADPGATVTQMPAAPAKRNTDDDLLALLEASLEAVA